MQCDFTGDEGPGPEDLNQNHPRVDTPVRCTRSNRSFHMRSPDSMVPDQARSPPSTVRQAPVVKPLSSAAKKRIAFAISCGRASRPSGCRASRRARPAARSLSLSSDRSVMDVSTMAGATEFTLIPKGARSAANAFVSASTAALLAAFMHRSLIMGACRRVVGFFEKPAQGDPPRRFSVAEMV